MSIKMAMRFTVKYTGETPTVISRCPYPSAPESRIEAAASVIRCGCFVLGVMAYISYSVHLCDGQAGAPFMNLDRQFRS